MRKRNESTLAGLGEWGFLNRLLPRLKRRGAGAFLVPPGDDAAILKGGERPVLSIDGLTEDTHFRLRWEAKVRSLLGVSLGRALAWKLLGSGISDLAAMGATDRRWAMIYLGAPGRTPASFLEEMYLGLSEAAKRFDCALAGGDTVRAEQITMVSAVGGRLKSRPLTRRGARAGMAVCVAGTLGDAAAGLRVLEDKSLRVSPAEARYFVRRFFDVRPNFALAAHLAGERGVGGAMDVSDALSDCLDIFCRDSSVGAEIALEDLPVSSPFLGRFTPEAALTGGEDYALLFAADPKTAGRLVRARVAAVIGRFVAGRGVRYTEQGQPVTLRPSFQHFK